MGREHVAHVLVVYQQELRDACLGVPDGVDGLRGRRSVSEDGHGGGEGWP